jgi:acyl-CoA dehydrogenase
VTVGLYHPTDDGPVARLDRAFKLAVAAQPLRDRMRKAHVRDADTARAQGLINESEAAQLAALAKAVADVINVDDFAPEELTRHGGVSSTISPANAA